MGFSFYLAILLSFSALVKALPRCRCLYGQSCWPKPTAFAALANQLSQPLIQPKPPALPCYSQTGNCSDVIANYNNALWRSDQPGALQNINFESFIFSNGTVDGCYLNVTLGFHCQQGSIPPIGVDARSVSDVQAAVRFARSNNLRLVVKNTGHDLLGRSAGRGGFMVWTHYLTNKSYNAAFSPIGAPANEIFGAVTLGSGVQWKDAYAFVSEKGRFVTGGISLGGSVGSAGGWIMGGGHSVFSPTFGLGVDNVLQFSIVLADGTSIIANAYQHPDLFWALRGGGGGTYGVVTSVTYKTYPTFPLTVYALAANFTSSQGAQEVLTEFIKLHPTFSDAGWGGYTVFSNTTCQITLLKPNASKADANSLFLPLTTATQNATGGSAQIFPIAYPSFLDWYTELFSLPLGQVAVNVEVAVNAEIASRLLPRTLAVQNPAKAAQIMLSVPGQVVTSSGAGGAVSKVDPSSTGLNPSWRNAVSQVYVATTWSVGSSAATISQAIDGLKADTDTIDKLTTDSGSYYNEGSLHERDFKKSFFGSHYSKLLSIKAKYDPTSLFIVASGVGSDQWDKDLQCRL